MEGGGGAKGGCGPSFPIDTGALALEGRAYGQKHVVNGADERHLVVIVFIRKPRIGSPHPGVILCDV